jgi:hypothetical protein
MKNITKHQGVTLDMKLNKIGEKEQLNTITNAIINKFHGSQNKDEYKNKRGYSVIPKTKNAHSINTHYLADMLELDIDPVSKETLRNTIILIENYIHLRFLGYSVNLLGNLMEAINGSNASSEIVSLNTNLLSACYPLNELIVGFAKNSDLKACSKFLKEKNFNISDEIREGLMSAWSNGCLDSFIIELHDEENIVKEAIDKIVDELITSSIENIEMSKEDINYASSYEIPQVADESHDEENIVKEAIDEIVDKLITSSIENMEMNKEDINYASSCEIPQESENEGKVDKEAIENISDESIIPSVYPASGRIYPAYIETSNKDTNKDIDDINNVIDIAKDNIEKSVFLISNLVCLLSSFALVAYINYHPAIMVALGLSLSTSPLVFLAPLVLIGLGISTIMTKQLCDPLDGIKPVNDHLSIPNNKDLGCMAIKEGKERDFVPSSSHPHK